MFDIDMFEGWYETDVFTDVFYGLNKVFFYFLSYQWNTWVSILWITELNAHKVRGPGVSFEKLGLPNVSIAKDYKKIIKDCKRL